MEVCRACLSNDKGLIPIDETFVSGYNLLTSLNIMISDGLSQYACQSCGNAVKFYLFFREKSITSESTLQQRLLEALKSESENNNDFLNEETKIQPLTVPKLRITKRKHSKYKYDSTISKNDSDPHLTTLLNHLDGNANNTDNGDVKIKQEVEAEQFDQVFESGFEESIDFEDIHFLVKNEEMDVDDIKPKKLKSCKKKKSLKTAKLQELSCGLCAKTFEEKATLSEHLEAHKKDSRCGLCQEQFPKWPTLLAHRLVHIDKKQYRCHICAKFCGYVSMMEFHYMKSHDDGQKPEFNCKVCLRSYDTPRKLRKHIWSSHAQRYFVCDYCSKSFNNKQRLGSHIKMHSDARNYACDTCGFTCKRSTGLKDHIIRKHCPKKVYCKLCRGVFATPEIHAKHSCKEVFKICPICGIQITRASRISRHMQKHKERGTHKCDRCPAVYRTKTALKVHINRHDGVRTEKCEFCPRSFYSPSVLIKHRRVHTGEKPYVCKVCQKGFTGNHNLKVHMKVHGEHNLIVKRVKEPTDFN